MRRFLYTPKQEIQFEGGRYKLLENHMLASMATNIARGLLGGSLYVGYRLLRYYAGMSWLSLTLHSGLLLGLAGGVHQLLTVNRLIVREVYLLDDGKELDIVIGKLTGKRRVERVKIKDILHYDDHLDTKVAMVRMNAWVLRTYKDMYLISPSSNVIDGEVTQAALRGQEIDVSQKEEAEVIDI